MFFIIQASTSRHIREAVEVHRLLTRGLIQTLVVVVVVVDKASQFVAYCVFYKDLATAVNSWLC